MPRFFKELEFDPPIEVLLPSSGKGHLAIFTGLNNSGKSAYLKTIVEDKTKLYIGVNRFYSFHHMSLYSNNEQEIDGWFNSTQHSMRYEQFQNFESSFFNCATALTRLTDQRRQLLFNTFEELFDTKICVEAEDPNNEFSNRYVSVGGDSLSVTSSGTRLFLGILAALMDERFSCVAIDEPELGLSPALQRKLADIILKGKSKAELMPHNPNIALSTHSHIFLDKQRPSNNLIVRRSGNIISARPCRDLSELRDVQFRLLGNDLGELLLPDAVVFVEGKTDKQFLEKVFDIKFPQIKIVVQECGGDIAKRLTYWKDSLGDIQTSPYRDRTFVVYDSVKQPGLDRVIEAMGLPAKCSVEWTDNGIEYLYPARILADIYRQNITSSAALQITGDSVSFGGDISYKKSVLCEKVCEALSVQTVLPDELESKLLGPLRQSIGAL